MLLIKSVLVFFLFYKNVDSMCPVLVPKDKALYQTFYGHEILEAEKQYYEKINATFWCTIEVKKCDPDEWRRVDGTCNNLQNPIRGGSHTPMVRLQPAVFDKVTQPRKSKSGRALPLARRVRTTLLPDGTLSSPVFTHLVTYFLVFTLGDSNSIQDTLNFIFEKPYCCEPRGKSDPECVPNAIPDDDPVLRFTNMRCLNMTNPKTFQSSGCINDDINVTPNRTDSATPLIDLSLVYGQSDDLLAQVRTFKNGLLKTEEENGMLWPPGTKSQVNLCYTNQQPYETRCYDIPNPGANSLLGLNLFTVWMWRNHNHIAQNLAEINPCWNDERIFYVAKDINIATFNEIYFNELAAILLGRDNLLRDGILTNYQGHRDLYDENVLPQTSIEYSYAMRWVHGMQESAVKMFDDKGYYLKQISIANVTLRTGYVVNNMRGITQGAFRQPCAHIDGLVDPVIGEIALGGFQKLTDLTTSDLAKAMHFGIAPYKKYREYCSGLEYKSFGDFADTIDSERIELLQELYEYPEDVDLLSGLWVERPIEGGYIPSTLYCIVADQLKRFIVSDRHWYERKNRPHAFTLEQLLEIRKASVSRLLCDVGDSVTQIQARGFERISPDNPLRNCKSIPSIDLQAWTDDTCIIQ